MRIDTRNAIKKKKKKTRPTSARTALELALLDFRFSRAISCRSHNIFPSSRSVMYESLFSPVDFSVAHVRAIRTVPVMYNAVPILLWIGRVATGYTP